MKTHNYILTIWAKVFLAGVSVLFVVSLVNVIGAVKVMRTAEQSSTLRSSFESPLSALERFPDAAAWLVVDDTNIDLPIMATLSNTYYLNHDPNGEYSLAGAVFLDNRNATAFTDPCSIIYGHHLENGLMFGALDNYENIWYFDNHRTGTLTTRDRTYNINIFAVKTIDLAAEDVLNPYLTDSEVRELARIDASIYRKPGDGNIMMLSTCRSNDDNARLIIFAEIQPIKGEDYL